MKGMLLKYLIVFTLVMVTGAMLMNVSQHVQRAEREIARVDREIAREEESIRVLKAEWAYLNDPMRLEQLVGGLDLISPEAAALISDMSVIPDDEPDSSIFIPRRSPLHRDISYVSRSESRPSFISTSSLPPSHNNEGAQ